MLRRCMVVGMVVVCLSLLITVNCLATGVGQTEELTIAPNPFIPNDGKTNTGSWMEGGGVTFGNLAPEAVEVRIYTLAGELIAEGTLSTRGEWIWNGRNQEGNKVASGIYFYIVTGPSGEKFGKLIVIT